MHAHLPKTIISDIGSAFVSHVMEEVADALGITLQHDTTNHAQTTELVEQSNKMSSGLSLKQALKIETGERRSLWHKNVSNAVLNYHTY